MSKIETETRGNMDLVLAGGKLRTGKYVFAALSLAVYANTGVPARARKSYGGCPVVSIFNSYTRGPVEYTT